MAIAQRVTPGRRAGADQGGTGFRADGPGGADPPAHPSLHALLAAQQLDARARGMRSTWARPGRRGGRRVHATCPR